MELFKMHLFKVRKILKRKQRTDCASRKQEQDERLKY